MRYYDIREYRCPADYYDNLAKGLTPTEFYRRQDEQADKFRKEQEAVDRKTWGMGINE